MDSREIEGGGGGNGMSTEESGWTGLALTAGLTATGVGIVGCGAWGTEKKVNGLDKL